MLFLNVQRTGQRDVPIQMPFVELIKDDEPGILQTAVVLNAARKYSLGDNPIRVSALTLDSNLTR